MDQEHALRLLKRIAEALERQNPPPPDQARLDLADAFVWQPDSQQFQAVGLVNRVPLDLLLGIERQAEILRTNTSRFARGLPANNALLWGARGMGKSSLVKAVHAAVNAERRSAGDEPLCLIEIHREDLATLPLLLRQLAGQARRCLLFCDDLTFEQEDSGYKSLKAVLEGGLEGRPDQVLFYATSNRRHLMPRDMVENEQQSGIHPGEAVEEKVSLSDRFGLWLGFHACDQSTYLAMVAAYARRYGLDIDDATRDQRALDWAQTRGSRSGRVAWQFIQDLAGSLEQPLQSSQAG